MVQLECFQPGVDLEKYSIESVQSIDIEALEKDWLALQEQADCSFFQSWSWIGSWLARIADELSPRLVIVRTEGELVGLAVFISTEVTRHHVISSRSMFLNEAPFSGNNMVIEYNGLLVARGHESGVHTKVIKFLIDNFPEVDEFYFSAMSSVADIARSIKPDGSAVKYISQQESPTWLVKLDDLGDGVDAYLATLSKNRRLQIKRSLRLYNEVSPVQVEEAGSIEQALSFFDGLKKLHTDRWHSVGKTGSFANTRWEMFHRSLIASCYDRGEIQLLKNIKC
jgi:CelD/BcsL family acetyltransferase involved in cellulose biosynthesis